MVSFRSAVAPLAILATSSVSLVEALPSPVHVTGDVPSVVNTDGTLNERAVQQNVAETFAKLEAIQQDSPLAFRKTQVALPVSEKRRLDKRSTAGAVTAPLDGSVGGGYGFAISAGIGTPAQTANFIFDTGSYDMIVQSTTDNGAAAFNSSQSTTYTSDGEEVSFDYVSGSYTGTVATDTFTIAGLSVAKQAFGLIDSKSGTPGVSGTLGLGFSSQSVIGDTNFFSKLVAAGKVPANQIGVYLNPVGGSGAEVTLGGTDTSRYKGSLQTLENDPRLGRWSLRLRHAYFDNSYVPTSAVEALVLLDSGSTQSFLPRAFTDPLFKKIPGAVLDDANSITLSFLGGEYKVDRWTIPCTANNTIAFQFNEYRPVQTMPKWQITSEALNAGPAEEGSDMCAVTLYGVDISFAGVPVGILGVPFLRGQYTVFNYGSTDTAETISFGKLA